MTNITKLIFLSIISISACTMKVPCDNSNIKLGFISFADTSTNLIILRQFKKSSNFKLLIDTVLITNINGSYKKFNDSLQIEYSFNSKHGYTSSKYGLTSEYDYEIYLPVVKRKFQINDIDEEYTMQKKGITSDTSTCNNFIKNYSVNGHKIIGHFRDLTIYFNQ